MSLFHTATLAIAGIERDLVCRWPDAAPVGAVVFCHGLGGHGREYAALSAHWAEAGYLVIHPTFDDAIEVVATERPDLGLDPTSDLSNWTSLPGLLPEMHRILMAPRFWLSRLGTVDRVMAALPEITRRTCGESVDLPTAIAGHSFGAFTAQLLAGAVIDLPDDPGRSFADGRFTSALILSGQGQGQQGLRDGSWDQMTGPVLTITGTLDRGATGGGWAWKAEPFTQASAPGQSLAVIDGGGHFLGGFDGDEGRHAVPEQAAALRFLTRRFLDATLTHDPTAIAALTAPLDRIGTCRITYQYR